MIFVSVLVVQVATYAVLAGVFFKLGDFRLATAQILVGACQAVVFSKGLL